MRWILPSSGVTTGSGMAKMSSTSLLKADTPEFLLSGSGRTGGHGGSCGSALFSYLSTSLRGGGESGWQGGVSVPEHPSVELETSGLRGRGILELLRDE
jgi:hypothetical protein